MLGSFQPRAVIGRASMLAVACGAALSLSFVIGASTAGATLAKPAGDAAQARKLAGAVVKAKSTPARVRAVTAVMRELGVGIVTQSGRPLNVAIDRGAASRVHLYDFELRALAAALGRHQGASFASVAAGLSSVGFTLDADRGLPPELLQEGFAGAVKAARRRGAHGSLLVLLVQQLGAQRGEDPLAKPAGAARLDPLQAWLLSADFAFSALRQLPASAPARLSSAHAAGLPDVCQKYRDAMEKAKKEQEAKLGKGGSMAKDYVEGKVIDQVKDSLNKQATRWGVKVMPGWAVRGAKKAGARAAELMKVVHGSLLALSVEVTTPDAALPGAHWGHDGPGDVVDFRVKVEMLDNYGDLAVKCGALAGLELPPYGLMKDVAVNWNQAEGDIKAEGALSCPPPAIPIIGKVLANYICVTKTGDNGIAHLRVQTNGEAVPGVGIQTQNTGVMSGVANYQSANGGGLTGWIGQFLFPKDGGGTRWHVASHQCGGIIAAKPLAALAFTQHARRSGFAPACGALYAKINAKVTTVATRPGCPDHSATAVITGATSTVPDTESLDTTVGPATASGGNPSILFPADAPSEACKPDTSPFSGIPFVLNASVVGDKLAMSWGPRDEVLVDPVAPDVWVSLVSALTGFEPPIKDGTYEFDVDPVGGGGLIHQHWTVVLTLSSSPLTADPLPAS